MAVALGMSGALLIDLSSNLFFTPSDALARSGPAEAQPQISIHDGN
jgi:hypothetical protein